jgi:single-strand DNA-binding protein
VRSVNVVTLSGNLTRDPELRQTSSGMSVCQMGLAVNDSYKDSSGQWQEKPNFLDVVVWGAQGEACAKALVKGSPVTVAGKLTSRSWEAQDGSKRSKVEVTADTVIFHQRGTSDDVPF